MPVSLEANFNLMDLGFPLLVKMCWGKGQEGEVLPCLWLRTLVVNRHHSVWLKYRE